MAEETEIAYSPSSMIRIFANTLNNEVTRRQFKIKGSYIKGNGINYKRQYFDTLKDEATEGSVTLVVPGIIRSKLTSNSVIDCNAYLNKKVQFNGGRIELQVSVIDLLTQARTSYSETQLKAFEILQRKAEAGHKDVDSFIRSKIINSEPVSINILIGKSGIIDSDIKHQLKKAISFYKISFIRINLSYPNEIIEALKGYDGKTDLIAISRGGGDNMEIFENPEIAEASLNLKSYFVTVIKFTKRGMKK